MRECWNCGSFSVYYTKSYKGFDRKKTGYCKKLNNMTNINETCYLWNSNDDYRKTRKLICLETLNEMANNISEITQILREEKENNKGDK